MTTQKYVIKLFNGDDAYSFAIFRKEDVKHVGSRRVVFAGEATPVCSGMSRREAEHYMRMIEKRP